MSKTPETKKKLKLPILKKMKANSNELSGRMRNPALRKLGCQRVSADLGCTLWVDGSRGQTRAPRPPPQLIRARGGAVRAAPCTSDSSFPRNTPITWLGGLYHSFCTYIYNSSYLLKKSVSEAVSRTQHLIIVSSQLYNGYYQQHLNLQVNELRLRKAQWQYY